MKTDQIWIEEPGEHRDHWPTEIICEGPGVVLPEDWGLIGAEYRKQLAERFREERDE